MPANWWPVYLCLCPIFRLMIQWVNRPILQALLGRFFPPSFKLCLKNSYIQFQSFTTIQRASGFFCIFLLRNCLQKKTQTFPKHQKKTPKNPPHPQTFGRTAQVVTLENSCFEQQKNSCGYTLLDPGLQMLVFLYSTACQLLFQRKRDSLQVSQCCKLFFQILQEYFFF